MLQEISPQIISKLMIENYTPSQMNINCKIFNVEKKISIDESLILNNSHIETILFLSYICDEITYSYSANAKSLNNDYSDNIVILSNCFNIVQKVFDENSKTIKMNFSGLNKEIYTLMNTLILTKKIDSFSTSFLRKGTLNRGNTLAFEYFSTKSECNSIKSKFIDYLLYECTQTGKNYYSLPLLGYNKELLSENCHLNVLKEIFNHVFIIGKNNEDSVFYSNQLVLIY